MPKDTNRCPSNHRETPGASQSRDQSQQSKLQRFWTQERAQTSIDLLLAIMIFFSAVALLTITSPDLFFPQGLSATDDTTDADRIGIELVNGQLTEPGVTGLSHANVTTFFSDTGSLADEFGVEDGKSVNVSISANASSNPPLALDPDRSSLSVDESGERYVVYRGDAIDGTSSQVNRTATINDEPVTITVTVFRS